MLLGTRITLLRRCWSFNGHPPLGVNATQTEESPVAQIRTSFNGHPPLGVNATGVNEYGLIRLRLNEFQWAPTLGGECYNDATERFRSRWGVGFNGHPPLGVNATIQQI